MNLSNIAHSYQIGIELFYRPTARGRGNQYVSFKFRKSIFWIKKNNEMSEKRMKFISEKSGNFNLDYPGFRIFYRQVCGYIRIPLRGV